jgi:hypothetical protein
MQSRDATVARPSAESISRHAARLLAAQPGMLPLEAVRLAMEAAPDVHTGGAGAARAEASGNQGRDGADEAIARS